MVITSVMPVSAQVGINQVRGNYVNSDLGFAITLPNGWQGTEFSDATIVTPGNIVDTVTKPETTMVIAGVDKSEFKKIPSPAGDILLDVNVTESLNLLENNMPQTSLLSGIADCKELSSTNIRINGAVSFVTERECTGQNISMKIKAYFVESGDKLVSLAYITSPANVYDNHIADFDASVSTLKIFGAAGSYERMGLYSNNYSIVMGGKLVDFRVYSNSTISNFIVNKITKQISFTVTGTDGTRGRTIVPVDKLMNGPFVVQFDGKNMTNFKMVQDPATGESGMQLEYDHSSHQIVISGVQMVPEFPLNILMTIFISTAMIVAFPVFFNKRVCFR